MLYNKIICQTYVDEAGFKPTTLVFHNVLSLKLLALKIHLYSRTDVVILHFNY